MALVDHWMSSLRIHSQNGTLALVKPEWVFPLGIHPQSETVGDTLLIDEVLPTKGLYLNYVTIFRGLTDPTLPPCHPESLFPSTPLPPMLSRKK